MTPKPGLTWVFVRPLRSGPSYAILTAPRHGPLGAVGHENTFLAVGLFGPSKGAVAGFRFISPRPLPIEEGPMGPTRVNEIRAASGRCQPTHSPPDRTTRQGLRAVSRVTKLAPPQPHCRSVSVLCPVDTRPNPRPADARSAGNFAPLSG